MSIKNVFIITNFTEPLLEKNGNTHKLNPVC